MHTTLPQLSNLSSTFFDIRNSAGESGFGPLQSDRESQRGFSFLLKSMRGGRGSTSQGQAVSPRADIAQDSSHAAQNLPNERDDSDAQLHARVGVSVENDSEGALDERRFSTTDAEAAIGPTDGVDHGDGTQEADVLVRPDHPDTAIVVEPGVDESIEGNLGDEGVEDEPAAAGGTPVRARGPAGNPAITNDADDDQDDDAVRRTGGHQRSERGQHVTGEQHYGLSGISRAEMVGAPATAKQTAVSGQPERGIEEHQIRDARGQSRSSSMKAADESSPPPHLERSPDGGHERRAEQREPMVIDQRDHREHRVMPAASRALQVESQVRLENASGQSGATDISSRIALAAQGGSNGTSFAGEQNGQNLPGHALGSAERAIPDDARFSGRVIRGLTAMINQRGGTMTMRLDPPDLGQLRIQMTLARGTVSASFYAQTSQARALLEKNMAALRTALENQGLTVERLNVQSSQSSSQQGHLMNDDNAQRQHDHQRHNAAEGESRGRRDDRGESRSDRQSSGEFADVIEQLEQTKHIRH